MNLNKAESLALVTAIASGVDAGSSVEVAVFPPSVYLDSVIAAANGILVGAQNVSEKENGAMTGEISCQMLTDLGATLVILGHSERRAIMRETSGDVNLKAKQVIGSGLTPLVCIGEVLEEREAGRTMEVVLQQCAESLAGFSEQDAGKTVIAYEPVWAIGTGKVATPEQAEEVHAAIRAWLSKQFGEAVSQSIRILYGGSVKPDNAAELLGQLNIDGALVGGASLKADSFLGIVAAAGQLSAV